jgi:hypothetical protein
VTASLSVALSKDGRNFTRVSLRYSAPHESAQAEDRAVELLAVGEDAQGHRTEPIRWAGTASRVAGSDIFEATVDLCVPADSYRWSLGVRDEPTGLVAYVLTAAESTARGARQP